MHVSTCFWPRCPFVGHTYLMPSPAETKYNFVPPSPFTFPKCSLNHLLNLHCSPADLLYSLKYMPFPLPLHILKTFSHTISSSLPLDPAPSLSHVPCPVLSMYLTVIFLSNLLFYPKYECIAFFWSISKVLPDYMASHVGRLLHSCGNLSAHICYIHPMAMLG